MKLPKHLVEFLYTSRGHFLERKFVFELFSVVMNRAVLDVTVKLPDDEKGSGYTSNRAFLQELQNKKRITIRNKTLPDKVGTAVVPSGSSFELVCYARLSRGGDLTNVYYVGKADQRPMDFIDTFTLTDDMIMNFPKDKPAFETSVGAYFVNQIVLAMPFEDRIPYATTMKEVKGCEKVVAEGLLSQVFTAEQYAKYINNLFILQSYAELAVPTASWKSLTTHPDVRKRKRELLLQYAGRLNDPLIAKKIEDELKALDAKHLEGDPSVRFIDALGAKSRDIHRKKLLLTVGGIEAFDDVSGNYVFMPNALGEGWDPRDFPAIVNEIRKGSYNRGKETELGGMQSKFVMRIFSDVRVTDEDCGTTEGVKLVLTEDWAKKLLNRFIVVRGKPVELTKEVIKQYLNTEVVLRSPMTCKSNPGFCYTCTGKTFKNISVQGVSMLVVEITSTFTLFSMKNMHGTAISVFDLAPCYERFLV